MDPSKELVSSYDSETFGKDGSFYLDKPVGSASISPCGRDIVLASRHGLHIIDLDSPYAPPRHLVHHTPWEVADVQWSPFAARDYWVVSTSNQKALVWNLGMISAQSSVEHVLHGHKRAITDINFSAHHPDILATCAVDSYVHCWDIRHPAKPAMTFCDWFAGATQVKWNRQDSHILASSHDKCLKIWDDRKGAHPLKSIAAHCTKIYGVDWDRLDTESVATCSLDKTIKVWNFRNGDDEPQKVIYTPFPVWRARHTPFGSGLLALPQRGDHDLHLYDRRAHSGAQCGDIATSTHRFSGHRHQVKEFLWRSRGVVTDTDDDREFQLVSWGTDKLLRLHEVSEEILGKVGYTKGMQIQRTLNFTRRGATYKTFRDAPEKQMKEGSDDVQAGNLASADHRPLFAGMNRTSLLLTSGYGSRGFMSSVLYKKNAHSREMDPVSWMRGVKIGKRAVSPSAAQQNVGSIVSPALKPTPAWDVFESLGEEISASVDKFPKIKAEDIDVQRRRLTISLSGPWASEKAPTQLKCRFDFPSAYPKSATPSLMVEKSSALDDETASNIVEEATELANGFLSQQRNSLEAILRYLLGEQSLEEGLKWLKKHQDVLYSGTEPELASSSDEDDDVLGEYSGQQNQGLESSDPVVALHNAQYNVPLPKACGALWAANGCLVCFFPVKQDKETCLLSRSLAGHYRFQIGSNDLFEGFGKFRSMTCPHKRATSTLGTITSGDSDQEDFESTSSESSCSSYAMGIPSHNFMPLMPWNDAAAEIQLNSALDASQWSIGETAQPSTAASKGNVVVSIHDVSDLLPVKKCLAREYVHYAGCDAAVKNASVARLHGFEELADVWTLASFILQETVPVDAVTTANADESFLVMRRPALSALQSKDSTIDLSFDVCDENWKSKQRLPVQWSSHPFGRRLVDTMFQQFELKADVQMLAMLACVFAEPRDLPHQRQISHALTHPELDLHPTLNPTHSLRYYASEDVARSLIEFRKTKSSVGVDTQRGFSGPHSTTSSMGAAASDPAGSLSGITFYKPIRNNYGRRDSYTPSLSTSPEQHRQKHKASSNLSVFAASFPRPFQTSHSAASSPPKPNSKKRSSPASSYLGPAQYSIAGASLSWINRGSTMAEDGKSRVSASISDTDDEVLTTNPPIVAKPSVSVKLKNQDQFHEEGYATMSLLDPNQAFKYTSWRKAYADYLDIWDMPVAMAEIQKHNHTLRGPSSDQSLAFGESAYPLDFRAYPEKSALELVNHCPTCFSINPPRGEAKSNKCLACRRLQYPLICVFCNAYVFGLSSPCLQCGHTMHLACRTKVTSSGLFDECITGCGCVCGEHDTINMPMPESRQQRQTRISSMRENKDTTSTAAGKSSDVVDMNDQGRAEREDTARVSLARNLEGKRRESSRLRTMGSHIWRGS